MQFRGTAGVASWFNCCNSTYLAKITIYFEHTRNKSALWDSLPSPMGRAWGAFLDSWTGFRANSVVVRCEWVNGLSTRRPWGFHTEVPICVA